MYDQHDSTATPLDPPQCITQLIIPRTVTDVSPPSFLQHPVIRCVLFDWTISVSLICDPLELGSVIRSRQAQFPQPLLILRVPPSRY